MLLSLSCLPLEVPNESLERRLGDHPRVEAMQQSRPEGDLLRNLKRKRSKKKQKKIQVEQAKEAPSAGGTELELTDRSALFALLLVADVFTYHLLFRRCITPVPVPLLLRASCLSPWNTPKNNNNRALQTCWCRRRCSATWTSPSA